MSMTSICVACGMSGCTLPVRWPVNGMPPYHPTHDEQLRTIATQLAAERLERMQAIVDAAIAWRNGTGTRHALILLVQAYTPEEP